MVGDALVAWVTVGKGVGICRLPLCLCLGIRMRGGMCCMGLGVPQNGTGHWTLFTGRDLLVPPACGRTQIVPQMRMTTAPIQS